MENAAAHRTAGPRSSRGLGVLAGVVAFAVVGVADGVVSLLRAPAGSITWGLYPLVVLHCVGVLVSFGLFWGLLGEALLAAGERVELLRRFGRWSTEGPRRWYARNPPAALGTLCAVVGLCVGLGPVFPGSYYIVTHFHSKALASLAIFLLSIVFAVGAGAVVVLLAPLLRWVLSRVGPLASPGAVVTFSAAALALQTARFTALNWLWLRNLEWGAAAVALALLLGNLWGLTALGAWRHRKGTPVRRRSLLAVAALSTGAFLLSALTFGSRQTVASTIFNRSAIARYVARGLQGVVDLDRDGYSAFFNGGDCNDRNPRINPGAPDLPGNGVDENCSGRDARLAQEEDHGHFADVPPAFAGTRPSFVLVSIDAMRPDHMGAYGYRRPTTPHLDAFAQGAARFTNAYCASPRSLRSFSSIWTGRYASLNLWGADNQFPPLEPSNVTLAEALGEAGYLSAAYINANYFSRTTGFFQGFREYHEYTGWKAEITPVVTDAATWIRSRAAEATPFFLWVHMMEPHDPYRDLTEPRDFGHAPMDQYDEEIARADQAAQVLLDAVNDYSNARPLQPVVVAIIGDHGEGFGEHGMFHHSWDLHEEAVRVPILLRGPGITPGPRAALTSLMDLHPTFLNLAGLRPTVPLSSRSLVPVLQDPSMPLTTRGWRDHLYGEVTPDGLIPAEVKSLYAPPYKLIWDLHRGTWELFDIARDPREVHNLYDDRPELAQRMRERLLTWVEGAAVGATRTADYLSRARLAREPATMQVPLRIRFGDVVELLGYDIESRHVPIGGTVRMTFYYRVLGRTTDPLWMGVWFYPTDNQPIWGHFHMSHYPLQGRYPTTQWNPGELLRDEVSLVVEPEMRPCQLKFRFAVERSWLDRRVRPSERAMPDGSVELGDLEILPAPAP